MCPLVYIKINGFFFGLLQALLNAITKISSTTMSERIDTVGGSLFAVTLLFYAYYQFWQQVTNLSSKLFPNGIGINHKIINRRMLEIKPLSTEEAENIIEELKKLTAKQKTLINRVFYSSIGISYIIPCILTGNLSIPDISLSTSGPALIPYRDRRELQGFPWLIDLVARSVQGIPIVKKLLNYYLNYNTPKQISKCQHFLNAITNRYHPINDQWEIAVKGDKNSVIFSLLLTNESFTLPNNENRMVTCEDMLIELQHVMLEQNLPIFEAFVREFNTLPAQT